MTGTAEAMNAARGSQGRSGRGGGDAHINYSPGLAKLNPKSFPLIYMVKGTTAAPGQITMFGSEPGETDYSPIWDEVRTSTATGFRVVVGNEHCLIGWMGVVSARHLDQAAGQP